MGMFLKCILLVCIGTGVLCQTDEVEETTTTTQAVTQTTQTAVSSISTTTDVDTKGDIIITSEPITDADTTSEINVTTFTTLTDLDTTTEFFHPNACSYNPCENAATCLEDPANPDDFTCRCRPGFVGIRCQVKDKCVKNKKKQICAKGACMAAEDGLSRSCGCFLGMFWDDMMKECRGADPPCFPNPCMNNGTCEIQDDAIFQCKCPAGFEGNMCEWKNQCKDGDLCQHGQCQVDPVKMTKFCKCDRNYYRNEGTGKCEAGIPPCLPNPCLNNGRCHPDNETFNCTCSYDFYGLTCEYKNLCPTNESGSYDCGNGGECKESNGLMKCECSSSYYWDSKNQRCTERVDPCHPGPCENFGKCLSLSDGTFNCSCEKGFTGKHCSKLDFCELKGGNTFCVNATCVNDEEREFYHCSCGDEEYFDYAERSCKKIDWCPVTKCLENEMCEDSVCQCAKNFRWNNESQSCEPHFCASNPCPVSDLLCMEGDGIKEYQCACPPGLSFDGEKCNKNAVCFFPGLNECDQRCKAMEDGYSCSCLNNNFTLQEDNKTCVYNGNLTCTNKTCSGGQCIVADDEEICLCPKGFIEDDDECIDLCSAELLPKGLCPDDSCESTKTGFRCKCEGKYILSQDKTNCAVRRMCSDGEEGHRVCKARDANCVEDWDDVKGYKCQCPQGMVEDDGHGCKDVCSFPENLMHCSKFSALCDTTRNGQLTCKCPPSFQLYKEETACNKLAAYSYTLTLPLDAAVYKAVSVTDRLARDATDDYVVDDKLVEADVYGAMSALYPTLLDVNVIVCKKKDVYLKCKLDLQFSAISRDYLQRTKMTDQCLSKSHYSPVCLVPPSLVLKRDFVEEVFSMEKTDPCDPDIKEDICGSETDCRSSSAGTSFNCTCSLGFAVRDTDHPFEDYESVVEICKDVNECESNPCGQNMLCLNTIGSFDCRCLPGYRPSTDKRDDCVELCNPSPCVHGKCNKLNDQQLDCRCDAGYSGTLCNLQDANFKRARTNTIIVGAVLGGCLLITFILSYAFISRLKKKKIIDSHDHRHYGTEMTERRNVDSGAINNAYQRD